MLSYKDVTEELIRNNILSTNEIFEYKDSPIYYIYESYFEYCQEHLTQHCLDYDIQPARFYFRNEFGVNAMAAKLNDYFIIGVNMDTIQTTYNLFYDKNELFKNGGEICMQCKELSENSNISLGFLMFQLSIQFTFHHELTHLIQKSPLLSLGMNEKYGNNFLNKKLIIERHVHEFDSDLRGGEAVFSKILYHYKTLPQHAQGSKNFVLLLSLGIATIYIYFILCLNRTQKLYYLEFTHPHPLTRIAYIVDGFIRVANENLPVNGKLNPEALTKIAFVISSQFLKSHKSLNNEIIDEFPDEFVEKIDSIENYVNDLLGYSRKFKNLKMNRA